MVDKQLERSKSNVKSEMPEATAQKEPIQRSTIKNLVPATTKLVRPKTVQGMTKDESSYDYL